ncbi:DUF2087 domain-containing protein [Kitasatospora sp. LaBMicrA B282]|uniref:DUF2087 domain-containing protein n=1 Tax=Kitasatospora sp. LaBMicrA B282 TaxID=3420949 RepID=UPI003D0C23E8
MSATDAHSRPQPHTGSRQVADLFHRGRLTAIPRRAARRDQLLDHLAETLFAPGREYREVEVNDALRTVHDDFPALRRYLVAGGRLARSNDGSSYRRASTTGVHPAE